MRRVSEVSKLLRRIFSSRRTRIISRLGLLSRQGRLPDRPDSVKYKELFRLAAETDLRRKAKGYLRRHVQFNKPIRFRPRATVSIFKDRTKQVVKRGPLIYVYLGYRPGKLGRLCVYVGKTKGHLGRPADHAKIIHKYKVTQAWLFRANNYRELAAAECLAIHAYGPEENRMKAARTKYQTECQICKRIGKAWREFEPLVRSYL